MRVFDKIDNPSVSAKKDNKPISKDAKEAKKPPRMNLSADEIRTKFNEHFKKDRVEFSNTTKKMINKNKEFNPDMDLDKYIDKEPKDILSDVKLNDPKDPGTQEKLKSVISKGAFSFNPKERDVLEKILNQA